MFHHDGISWMIQTKGKYHFAVDEQYKEWCTGRTWFNGKFFQNLHGPLFEKLFVTSREGRYDLMCGLHAYDKQKEK